MVDIEALSTQQNGIITNIGCVLFHIDTGKILKQKEYVLDWTEQCKAGRHVDRNTLNWWFSQDYKAQQAITTNIGIFEIREFYDDFEEEFTGNITKAWAKSPGFDYGMIENMVRDFKLPSLIPFRKLADCRDIYYLAKKYKIELPEMRGTAHNALDDAIKQTEDLCAVIKLMNERMNPKCPT